MRWSFSSLRVRLLWLFAFLFVMEMALFLQQIHQEWQWKKGYLREHLTHECDLFAPLLREWFAKTHTSLEAIAESLILFDAPGQQTNLFLEQMRRAIPTCSEFGIINSRREIIFSSDPSQVALVFEPAPWLSLPVPSGTCLISPFHQGKQADDVFLYLLISFDTPDGERHLYAAIPLRHLHTFVLSQSSLAKRILKIIDIFGSSLRIKSDEPPSLRDRDPDFPLISRVLTEHQGLLEETGFDQKNRIYAFSPLFDLASSPLFICIGEEEAEGLARTPFFFFRRLTLYLCVTLVAFAGLWFGSGLLILQPVKRILEGVEELRRGNFKVRSPLFEYSTEMNQLAQAVNEMAEALERNREDMKKAEQDLRKSEYQYRLLLNHLQQRVFLKDEHSRFVTANTRLAADLGLTPADLIGKTDLDFFPPDLARKYMADDRRVLETRQIFETDESYFQEGRQRWIHTVKVPVHDEASGLCGILGIFWDVTDQRILEEKLEQYRKDLENTVQIRTAALQETEERFRVAATVITNLIWEWNIETGAMTWFGETLDQSGFSPQELPGTFEAWQRFIHPEDRPKVAQAIEAQIANGEAYRVEYRMTHRGSIPRIWMDRGKVLRDVAGKAVKMIGACIDITRQKLAEKAIRETGTKFRSLFDLSRDGIVYANLGGYFEDANPAFLQMIGYTLPELRKLTFKDITPGKWLHIETELVRRQLFSNGFTELFEKEYVRKDQTVFSVEVTIMCVRDSGGTPIRLWAIIRDITDRKLMENWLKENKHRLEMALRGANLGTWDWYPTTRKVLFNDKWAEILGLFLDEIPPHLDSIHSRLHPEDFPKYQERMNRHLAQETPYYESEHRMRHKNGDWHWVYECGRVVETDEQGKPLRVTGISRDITSRKQTEMALRETMSMYQSLAEASQDLIYVIDAGERISYVNTRAVQAMGSTLGEIIGRPLSSLFPPESVGKLQDNLHRVMTTGAPLLAEDELMVGSKALWLSSWLVPLTSGDQENHGVHAVLGVSRDISSQKKADLERQHYLLEVQKSNEELQQFAYIASHDLQEPLRSISGHLSLLEKRYQKAFDEQGLRSLHFAVDGAARMRDLIQALLSYARIGTQKIDVVRVDFARVIEQVKIDLEYTITQHQAQITHGELPTLTVSKNQMVQLFGNLVGNAIKFKRKDTPPIIEIAAVATAEGWKFSVKDNGIGIEPAYFDRIFKIFQKLHTREEYPGTGIGLSVCKRIVERHNGRIWVESEPGGGTTFFFTIRDTPEGSERS